MWADASHGVVIVVQLLTLLVVLFVARKAVSAARIAEEAKRTARRSALQATQQLEALDGLYARLHFERGTLPPTRGWAASPDFLTILYDHAAQERPEFILECGSGVSTIVLARCLQQIGHGHILSLDHDAAFGERTREHLARLGLSDYAEICIAPLVPQEIGTQGLVWYDLSKVDLPDRVDLVVVDGPPQDLRPLSRYPVAPALIPRLSDRGVMFFDDTNTPEGERVLSQIQKAFPNLTLVTLTAEKGCVRAIPK